MKSYFTVLLAVTIGHFVHGQRQQLDTHALRHWPFILGGGISNDGRYVYYITRRSRSFYEQDLTVRAVKDKWARHYTSVTSGLFTADSKKLVCRNNGDSLFIVELGTPKVECIPDVSMYSLSQNDRHSWLTFTKKGQESDLQLRDLQNDNETRFRQVKSYLLHGQSGQLLICTSNHLSQPAEDSVFLFDLKKHKQQLIWTGTSASSFVFDRSGRRLAFCSSLATANIAKRRLWYYEAGQSSAASLPPDPLQGNYSLEHVKAFSTDGSRVFLSVKNSFHPLHPDPSANYGINIWSYQDVKLQSDQLPAIHQLKERTAIFDIRQRKVIYTESEREWSVLSNVNDNSPAYLNDLALIFYRSGEGGSDEQRWNRSSDFHYSMISTRTGADIALKNVPPSASNLNISPKGDFLLYYDYLDKNYFSYHLRSGTIVNLTSGIITEWTTGYDLPSSGGSSFSVPAWSIDGRNVFLYDRHDIWLVPLDGSLAPRNITHQTGKKHGLILRLALKDSIIADPAYPLVLTAFDEKTKRTGIFRLKVGDEAVAAQKNLQDCLFYLNNNHPSFMNIFSQPVKAKFAEAYLVNKESSTASPNLFYTTDFKSFLPVTENHPEDRYFITHSQLHTWKSVDGSNYEGVLYTPENFDSTKRYPVIIHYYEQLTDQLNKYQTPQPMEGHLNIPWFTNHGYLVFTPDIHYAIGNPGLSALRHVRAAGVYLSSLPFIHPGQIGLQGQSFGGYETNFIASRDPVFAAAVASAGNSNLISFYGSIGIGNMELCESSQMRIGTSLWTGRELYIQNSPVFGIGTMNCPLLIVNNKSDGIPYQQGIELFTGLNKVNKRAWLLQYKNSGHTLSFGDDMDFTIRVTEFFDHYLRGLPAPHWMLHDAHIDHK